MGHYVRGTLALEPGDVVAVPGDGGYVLAIVSNLLGADGTPYVIWGSPDGTSPVRETPWDVFTRGEDALRTRIAGERHWTAVLREARARIGQPFEHRRLVQWAHGLGEEPRIPSPARSLPLLALALAGAALAGVAFLARGLLRR